MLNLRPEDLIHKSYINRLLIEIIDQPEMAQDLIFKGGTCASMLGYLDRFSVDLDFDLLQGAQEASLRSAFYTVFEKLGLAVVKEINQALFFQIRYPSEQGKRSNIKVSASNIWVASNQSKPQYLAEIDRIANCQTIETMFANKLVAVMDRYRVHQSIAGRDIYDIHHFFIHGHSYHAPVIEERTGLAPRDYLLRLVEFFQKHVTQTMINEDLNTLLPPEKFQQIRKILIPETKSLIFREIDRL